jgi:hypothetical protein
MRIFAWSRREFLAALAAPAGVRREEFAASPGKGTAVMARAWYTRARALSLVSLEERWSRSDTVDVAYRRHSDDNGRTWSAPETRVTGEKRAGGMLRRHFRGGWADPRRDVFIEFWMEGVLASDDPLEGLRQWTIYYSISRDGGRSATAARPLLHAGHEYDERHPLPGIWKGKNSVMLGDHASTPLLLNDGTLALPVEITPLGADGKLLNPGGGYTWGESALLLGRWKGGDLVWRMSSRVPGDPAQTTRGMLEPTLAELPGNRMLMVLRGSNDRKPELPGYRWACWSRDGGRNWSAVEPWLDTGGEPLYSPSSCSQLLPHSSGRLFWLGNLCALNPRGNLPRYPFVLGEVDLASGRLRRASVRTVDTRQAGDAENLMLSNFFAREDRESREVCVHLTRLFPHREGWEGNAYLYRVPV